MLAFARKSVLTFFFSMFPFDPTENRKYLVHPELREITDQKNQEKSLTLCIVHSCFSTMNGPEVPDSSWQRSFNFTSRIYNTDGR